jgi:hypothetical protein
VPWKAEDWRPKEKGIDSCVRVLGQYKPLWLTLISLLHDVCYSCGAPHILDLFLGALILGIVILALVASFRLF